MPRTLWPICHNLPIMLKSVKGFGPFQLPESCQPPPSVQRHRSPWGHQQGNVRQRTWQDTAIDWNVFWGFIGETTHSRGLQAHGNVMEHNVFYPHDQHHSRPSKNIMRIMRSNSVESRNGQRFLSSIGSYIIASRRGDKPNLSKSCSFPPQINTLLNYLLYMKPAIVWSRISCTEGSTCAMWALTGLVFIRRSSSFVVSIAICRVFRAPSKSPQSSILRHGWDMR